MYIRNSAHLLPQRTAYSVKFVEFKSQQNWKKKEKKNKSSKAFDDQIHEFVIFEEATALSPNSFAYAQRSNALKLNKDTHTPR